MVKCSSCGNKTSGGNRCRSCSNSQVPRRKRKCFDGVSICSSRNCGCDGRKKERSAVICNFCGIPKKQHNSVCTSHRCRALRQYKTDVLIAQWLAGKADGTAKVVVDGSRVTLAHWARTYLLVEADWRCTKCGWNTPHPITGKPPLEIDHIDGDRDNNVRENLDVLCPNCHALTPTYRRHNVKNRIEIAKRKAEQGGAASSGAGPIS